MQIITKHLWLPTINLWVIMTLLLPILGFNRIFYRDHITFTSLFIELVVVALISFGIIILYTLIKKPQKPKLKTLFIRLLNYFAIFIVLYLSGSGFGFSFAWDPNTTFQFANAGPGWPSTSALGGLIGIFLAVIIITAFEISAQRTKKEILKTKHKK